jgi:hypothetical protein
MGNWCRLETHLVCSSTTFLDIGRMGQATENSDYVKKFRAEIV